MTESAAREFCITRLSPRRVALLVYGFVVALAVLFAVGTSISYGYSADIIFMSGVMGLLLLLAAYWQMSITPLRIVLHDDSVTFILLHRTLIVPIGDLIGVCYASGVWLSYRGGRLWFYGSPGNNELWEFFRVLHQRNPKFRYP